MIRICPERDAQCPNGMACAEPCAGSRTHPLTPREQYEQARRDFNNMRDDGSLASGSGDHAELARLAEEASEGPWALKEGSTPYPESDDADSWSAILTPRGHEVVTLYERYGVKGEGRSDYDADAAFIAAANPATVLALLAEIAALRAERDWVAKELRHQANCAAEQSVNATEAERKLAEAVADKDAAFERLDAEINQHSDTTERLAEAVRLLEPFSEAAESLDDETRDHDHIWEQPAAMSIDAGHLRAARTFLSKEAERG